MFIWGCYLATGTLALAWTAVGVLMVTVCLGLSTVMLWTPYPARGPGERRVPAPWDGPAVVVPDTPAGAADMPGPPDSVITDEMIVQLLEQSFTPGRRRPVTLNPAVLVPIAHGFAAIGTFVLAVTTASM